MHMMPNGIVETILAVFKSWRTAGNEARDYLAVLQKSAEQLAKGRIDVGTFVANMMESIETFARFIYEDGAGDGYVLEDADEQLIRDWIDSQLPHIDKLAWAIKDEGMTSAIRIRLETWARSMSALAGVAYMQANRNKKGTWRRGAVGDSCPTCRELNGRTASLGWFLDAGFIPGQPGSAGLVCGGWKCQCAIIDIVTGRRLLPLVRRW